MHSGALLAFGVVLPLVTVVVELTTRLNASVFFDPLPTPLHALLVAFVVAANAWAWFVCRHRKVAHVRRAGLAVSFAIGVALFYSVLFAPLLPMATIGVLYFGLGLFPWAPLASLISAIRFRVHRRCGQQGVPRTWPAWCSSLRSSRWICRRRSLGLGRAWRAVTRSSLVHAECACCACSEARTHAAHVLRARDALHRHDQLPQHRVSATYIPTRPAALLRMTGHAFNRSAGGSVPAAGLFDAIGFDAGQGAEGVGRRCRTWLADSRRWWSADAALGYLE
jgi:hypothetical protein